MLEICKQFFDFLNEQGVRYCHWKSNEHLDRALAGKTDLDILVHQDDAEAFADALQKFDFREILSPPEKRFPGMADYLGFDPETGGLVHLHRHFLLVLGQRYIKNHHLPWEDLVFSDLRLSHGVAIPSPNVELLLLVLRMHLKVDLLSLVKHQIKDFSPAPYTAFPADIESELKQLLEHYDLEQFAGLLAQTRLPLPLDFFERFFEVFSAGKLRALDVWRGQRRILAAMKGYRRNTSLLIHWQYLCFFMAEMPVLRHLKSYRRKTLPHRAPVIALVGADGSGKSTLTEELGQWLSWKLSVARYYQGIPKNWVGKANYYTGRVLDRIGMQRLRDTLGGWYWLYVARQRRDNARLAQHDAIDGVTVVFDRFPLPEFAAMESPMDGMRLQANSLYQGNGQAEQEARTYAEITAPDKVFVLQVAIDELRRRKQDITEEEHRVKADAVNAIKDAAGYELIDANQPYDQVLLEIKKKIWALL